MDIEADGDRQSQTNREQNRKDSERIRNRETPRVSRGSEMRIPKETGRNRVQGREIRKPGKKRDSEPSQTDTHVETEAEGPGTQEEKGKWPRKPAGLAAPVRCAVATPCVAGARVCWDVFVHTFVCKRQLMLKQA